ncbi:MAG: protein kinase [Planctomycetota bacterium]
MKIGAYEILDQLGRGGMGVVHRARSPRGEDVAIKILSKRDPDTLARFERERRLLGQFTAREGFVPLLDAGVSPEGFFYLVMPLVPGGTLRSRLAKGRLALDETLALGRALAEALGRAHERGIVHRDLKPENVLFTAEGRPLVVDLGLAKHFRTDTPGASQSAQISALGTLRGTAGYMPPEQMSDARSAGPAADVFALGAILYECLTGDRAFAGESVLEVISKASEGRFDPIRSARPEVPVWFAAVVEKCLAPHLEERYADAGVLRRALERPHRTSRPLVVAVGALGVGALAVVALALSRGTPRPSTVPPASPTPSPIPTPVVAPSLPIELDANAYMSRAAARAARKDFAGAIADYDKVLALHPGDGPTFALRGKLKLTTRDLAGAIADFNEAIAFDPRPPGIWAVRGTVKAEMGDLDGALADLDHAVQRGPRMPFCYNLRADVKRQKKDLDGAIADLDKSIALDGTQDDSWLLRGLAKREKGDRDGAIADLEKCLTLGAPSSSNKEQARQALADLGARKSDR